MVDTSGVSGKPCSIPVECQSWRTVCFLVLQAKCRSKDWAEVVTNRYYAAIAASTRHLYGLSLDAGASQCSHLRNRRFLNTSRFNMKTKEGYKPGALADVVGLHMAYYHQNWGFGLEFETKVASELAEFLSRYATERDLFLAVYLPTGKCVGSITLDCQGAEEKGAHVRWFIVDQEFAGRGVGRQLMTKAVNHCDKLGFSKSFLTTFEGLHAARKLYESFDYVLTEERDVDQWSGGVKEQLFVRNI